MTGGARFDFMHFMPYAHLPENHKEFRFVVGRLPQQIFRPEEGTRSTSAIWPTGSGRQARLRRHRRQRAPQHRLQHDAGANLIAAALIPQTKNAKICVWGTPPISNIRTVSPRNTPCST